MMMNKVNLVDDCRWAEMPLGDLIELKRGYDLPSKSRQHGDIPIVSSAGISDSHNVKKVAAPGVVTGRYGTIGKVFYIEDNYWPLNTTLYVKDFKGNCPKFVYYLLKSFDFFKYSDKAAVPGVNRNHLHMEKICVPSDYVLQEKIADFISKFDDKIHLNIKTNKTLEEMAQAIFKSWFVDFDPVKAKMRGEQPEGDAQGCVNVAGGRTPVATMDAETAALFPDKLVESELGMIPEGWEVVPFKNVIDKYIDNRGKTPPVVANGIPLVEVKHLLESNNFPSLNTQKYVDQETFLTWFRVHVEEKDILISTVGTIGRTSFVKNTNLGIAQNVLGLRFGSIVESEYMFYTIKGNRFQHDMDARLVTTVQSSIKRKDLNTIQILVPPMPLQKEFAKVIETYLNTQYSKTNENQTLTNLRDTLLPKLLSGEIDLENLDTVKEATQ